MFLMTEGLGKRYGKHWAVSGVNLQVEKGDILGLLGPNGAGKSTIIRILTGLVQPSEGIIKYKGREYRKVPRENIRALIEVPAFYEYLSGWENLKIFGQLSGVKDEDRLEDILHKLGLYERRHDKVKTYSQGMKQRLGIAQAIMDKAELVILDEPTNGLDPKGIREIRELIRDLNRTEGITFIISSHLLLEIEGLCNRIVILQEGKIRAQGLIGELLEPGQSLEDFFIARTS
ncbi:MAG: ATP-binding cassette domain-containing protein [Halanaerobiales bacterium]|nr:ATP-binding cassette domain-containing protein [Bacillota bacterium]HOA41604.1 ATP-binding cassette domain-containing protein [Halanaerobiales bacterium]HPZ63919.1 ATP-binding cassette domain-containing protein [Halanaerobiales bacterium]HQD04579.1 ATP-binding cassette domain-containing protein [Halanaerobiales bacterium]